MKWMKFQYNCKSGNFSLRYSSTDKSMPWLLSEMGKACFSKWHRERLLRKASLRSLLSVSDDLILPAENSRFRRGLSPWWMWNLSGFLNYLASLLKGPSCGVLAGTEKSRSLTITAILFRAKFISSRTFVPIFWKL